MIIRKIKKVIKNVLKRLLYIIYVSRPDVLHSSELLRLELLKNSNSLNKKEQKIYSQHGEDGIILEIFKRIGMTNQKFFEFGAGDDYENNTIILLSQGWSGIWVDGGAKNIEALKNNFSKTSARDRIMIKQDILTSKNINEFIKQNNIDNDIDFISIDIDGNDYYVWKAMNIKPRAICVEFNSSFPPSTYFLDEERETFWNNTMWFGANITAFNELAKEKGYTLVCVDSSGANLFFVRNDLIFDRFEDVGNIEKLYFPPRYNMHFISGHEKCFR